MRSVARGSHATWVEVCYNAGRDGLTIIANPLKHRRFSVETESMRAITFTTPGGPEVLQLTEVPEPTPRPEQLLVRVRATALNRADTLQRHGLYPPPLGESDILGLELAGEVEAVGTMAQGFRVGDRVFGLVGGGSY